MGEAQQRHSVELADYKAKRKERADKEERTGRKPRGKRPLLRLLDLRWQPQPSEKINGSLERCRQAVLSDKLREEHRAHGTIDIQEKVVPYSTKLC